MPSYKRLIQHVFQKPRQVYTIYHNQRDYLTKPQRDAAEDILSFLGQYYITRKLWFVFCIISLTVLYYLAINRESQGFQLMVVVVGTFYLLSIVWYAKRECYLRACLESLDQGGHHLDMLVLFTSQLPSVDPDIALSWLKQQQNAFKGEDKTLCQQLICEVEGILRKRRLKKVLVSLLGSSVFLMSLVLVAAGRHHAPSLSIPLLCIGWCFFLYNVKAEAVFKILLKENQIIAKHIRQLNNQ